MTYEIAPGGDGDEHDRERGRRRARRRCCRPAGRRTAASRSAPDDRRLGDDGGRRLAPEHRPLRHDQRRLGERGAEDRDRARAAGCRPPLPPTAISAAPAKPVSQPGRQPAADPLPEQEPRPAPPSAAGSSPRACWRCRRRPSSRRSRAGRCRSGTAGRARPPGRGRRPAARGCRVRAASAPSSSAGIRNRSSRNGPASYDFAPTRIATNAAAHISTVTASASRTRQAVDIGARSAPCPAAPAPTADRRRQHEAAQTAAVDQPSAIGPDTTKPITCRAAAPADSASSWRPKAPASHSAATDSTVPSVK